MAVLILDVKIHLLTLFHSSIIDQFMSFFAELLKQVEHVWVGDNVFAGSERLEDLIPYDCVRLQVTPYGVEPDSNVVFAAINLLY